MNGKKAIDRVGYGTFERVWLSDKASVSEDAEFRTRSEIIFFDTTNNNTKRPLSTLLPLLHCCLVTLLIALCLLSTHSYTNRHDNEYKHE